MVGYTDDNFNNWVNLFNFNLEEIKIDLDFSPIGSWFCVWFMIILIIFILSLLVYFSWDEIIDKIAFWRKRK